MKFGSREIANVVFRAKELQRIGNTTFQAGQPVLYIDTATTSTVEGAATQVYAQGGRGNTRLVTWEGEKTLTFTVEDALLSPIGMAILSGAGLWSYKAGEDEKGEFVHVHTMSAAQVVNGVIDLTNALSAADGTVYEICAEAPIFVMETEGDGSLTGTIVEVTGVTDYKSKKKNALSVATSENGKTVMVDYYMLQPGQNVQEIQIDAEKFAGYFYVEAETLFRRQEDGVDMPANLTFPNVKIQSNFSFSMSATGDPSTFTFTMDAMPGYTYFNKQKKVLCAIQIINGKPAEAKTETVFGHVSGEAATNKDKYDEWAQGDSFKDDTASGQPSKA